MERVQKPVQASIHLVRIIGEKKGAAVSSLLFSRSPVFFISDVLNTGGGGGGEEAPQLLY